MGLGNRGADDRRSYSGGRYASPEELRYAKVLALGGRIGLLALIVAFALYVSDAISPLVPVANLPEYWRLSAREFAALTRQPTGWAWVEQIRFSDIATLAPIAFLAGVSVLCSLAVLPQFLRRRDLLQAAILALQIVVLVLAASNVIGAR